MPSDQSSTLYTCQKQYCQFHGWQCMQQLLQFKYSSRVCPLFLLTELPFHTQWLFGGAKYRNLSHCSIQTVAVNVFYKGTYIYKRSNIKLQ